MVPEARLRASFDALWRNAGADLPFVTNPGFPLHPGYDREMTMPVYTAHEPPRRDRDNDLVAHTSRFQFVRDGFHFWAFLLAPLWMLRHRMWLEFIVYLLLVGGLTFALRRLGIEET